METARKRILYFIENQNIKPSEFLKKTGLKKGFLDKSHENSGATDVFLSKILDSYPIISAFWLLTGKGEMIEKNIFQEAVLNEPESTYGCKSCSEKDEIITAQKKTINSQEELLNFYRKREEKTIAKRAG